MILAIDFDDTIHNPKDREKGYKLGKPMPNAWFVLGELHLRGHKIVVHCVWADTPKGIAEIEKWLEYFEIPYDEVTAKKPAADYYIDDKAMEFTGDWLDIKRRLQIARKYD